SYGEGFGLPLVKANQHKLPIIALDIPVFHKAGSGLGIFILFRFRNPCPLGTVRVQRLCHLNSPLLSPC
ncbi:MAG: hypothetical protein WCD46_12685, partial [Desulfobacterales bacterium]